jgi:hypothetical protein
MRTGPNFRSLQILLKTREQRRVDEAFEDSTYDRSRAVELARLEDAEKAYHLSAQFRLDVIQDLIDEGHTRQQAEGMTRDQARLFREAQRLGAM